MSVFAILRVSDPVKLKAAIENLYPNDFLDLGNNEWLISDTVSAVVVSEKLGITDALNGLAIIISFSSYYGRAPTPIWDWIKTKLEASNG